MKRRITNCLILAFAFLFTSCGYNTMVEKQEATESAWANVENQYQRRADLIPNLVNVVKGYAKHESSTLQAVIEARSKATSVQIDPSNMTEADLEKFQQAQDNVSSAMSKLMVVVEAYPELKANENFRDLQVQLEGTENRIAVERRKFNETAQDYNKYIKSFPELITAKIFGFDPKPYFKAQAGAETAPQVNFD